MTCTEELKLPVVWNLSARAMISAGKNVRNARQAASGLYAQGILGISEADCRRAKAPEVIDHLTLVDCLSLLSECDAETGEKLLEILVHGEKKILLSGGRGGKGNSHYKTATNQAPAYAQSGEEAVEKVVILELKLLADVGLVGVWPWPWPVCLGPIPSRV